MWAGQVTMGWQHTYTLHASTHPVFLLQQVRVQLPIEVDERARCHHHALVPIATILGQISQQVLRHDQRTSNTHLTHGVQPATPTQQYIYNYIHTYQLKKL